MDLEFEKPLRVIRDEIAALEAKRLKADAEEPAAIAALRRKLRTESARIYRALTPWETVQVARHPDRPTIEDYAQRMCTDVIELHGDRFAGDDPAIFGGFARIGDTRFMLIGHRKGRSVDENIASNFGMASPEGFRKALRLMKLAAKFGTPIVTLVDTPGAYPGQTAEERGIAEAIGRNLAEMFTIPVPILTIVTGEGGSGGALGIAVGDRVLMLEHAVYSVISPEGCASILWRDGAKAPEAAKALRITAKDLLELKVIDGIVPEPVGGAHSAPDEMIATLRKTVTKNLKEMAGVSEGRLLNARFRKYAAMGVYGK